MFEGMKSKRLVFTGGEFLENRRPIQVYSKLQISPTAAPRVVLKIA